MGLVSIAYNIQSKPGILQFTATDRRRTDRRKPLLLLRRFEDDEIQIDGGGTLINRFPRRHHEFGGSFYELIAKSADSVGPCLAVAREPHVKVGPAYLATSSDRWQVEVTRQIEQSRFLLYLAGESVSLGWELAEGARIKGASAMVFIVPPLATEAQTESHCAAFRRVLSEVGGPAGSTPVLAAGQTLRAEMSGRKVLAVVFVADEPVAVVGDDRDGWSYIIAIRLALAVAARGPASLADLSALVRSELVMVSIRSTAESDRAAG
jgi:hypothetical protein